MAGSSPLARRALLGAALLLPAMAPDGERLRFDDLYGAWSVIGLTFSAKAKAAAGKSVTMAGFMAPPLKAEADFFVLTREPMSICPFCSSDAEWPPDIVVAYLAHDAQPTAPNQVIEVSGTFELGSWTDPASGFVSQARLRDARFRLPDGPPLAIRGLTIAFAGVGPVLDVPAFDLPGGAAVAIEGPSGAGKTSLLHALAGLERPAQGTVRWGEVSIWSLPRPARDRWRRLSLGLVFQDIHLVDGLSAIDNVTLPLLFDHVHVPQASRERGVALLGQLGVAPPGRAVTVMSRGERQRVALARALLRRPSLILADEPTASLDRHSADEVAALMLAAAASSGATLVVTSHDPAVLERAPARWRLDGGRLAPA